MVCVQTKNTNFGKNLEGLGIENVVIHILLPFGIFYGHFVYFTAFWSSFWSFGIFFSFGMFGPRKIWQPRTRICTQGRRLRNNWFV
jgi:hypothetical protein